MSNWNQYDDQAERNRANYGAYDYRTQDAQRMAEEQRRRDQASQDYWNNQMIQSSQTKKKVICTELVRQGLMTPTDLRLGQRFVEERLSQTHVDGYHAWAIAVVRKMRKSPRTTKLFRRLAQARADHIAGYYGDASRSSLLGRVLCAIGEPMCWVIGAVKTPTDYLSLYAKESEHSVT